MNYKSIRRSLLYVPGNSEKMITKSLGLIADSIILDLEDAVSLTEKNLARANVKNSIAKFKEKNKEVIVRINDIKTKTGILDLESIVEELPNAIIVPKADEESLHIADILLKSTEKRYDIEDFEISIIPLLETSYSIVHAYNILTSSDRISAVQFGAEDLTKELGIKRTNEGKEIEYARNVIAQAGNACKIDILDTPYTDIDDNDGLSKDILNAKNIGFTGKTCIHPSQIEIVNDIFTPKLEDVENARQLIHSFDEAVKNGKGVCMFEGKMIDNPIADRARKLVEKADQISSL
ncbi:HpcH/HpaI aldolase/citrate lyase family protein [Anaerobacillus isosaccharinicus]|uniref:HpcH/HpaI aldolase/citrate lyase family protein n=2 Tax=Anaerobacillus isosaccharinicus TaxID=1532552 RepID=A0A7S7L966_9BACI|nr:CoA ester lyase [Anaerobacillus isosaccharinicus]MBA5585024.1 CoA ester lyase [Anaerobacillus isosaccharinicus]QOY36625.1 CoA ester lyase [Anaerobacillus isosaccharinicus]